MNRDFLSLLPYDILNQVCASLLSDHKSYIALDGVSRSNKHLRDVCLPKLFNRVVINGSWDFASSRIEAMEGCDAILPLVK